MRSFERVYELTQQTPMIHFQYGERGATLRATEVKPKLDKYIRKRCEVKKEWKLGDTEALNYRMKITAPDENPEISKNAELKKDCKRMGEKESKLLSTGRYDPQINKMYFGNMIEGRLSIKDYCNKVDEAFKETVSYKEKIVVTIVCMIKGLRDKIDECIEEFFFINNFGMRQTKGFGSFRLVAKRHDPNWKATNPVRFFRSLGLPAIYVKADSSSSSQMMDYAASIYSVMKGGVNLTRDGDYPEKYVKSYAQRGFFDYCNQVALKSEKAFIKENVFHTTKTSNQNYTFIRALLGLPNNYEYQTKKLEGNEVASIDKNRIKRIKVNIYSIDKPSDQIERMRSPITIKIIDEYLFFVFNSIEDKGILGREFYFLLSNKESRWFKQEKDFNEKAKFIRENGHPISTPGNIDWKVFINGFIDYYYSDKVQSGMKACGYPYSFAAKLALESVNVGGDNNDGIK